MNELLTLTAVALLISVGLAAQNLLRYAKARDWNGVLGIVLACVFGVVVVWLAAQAEVTDQLVFVDGSDALGDLDAASLVLVGIAFGTGASTIVDFRKAFDNNSSADKPNLVG